MTTPDLPIPTPENPWRSVKYIADSIGKTAVAVRHMCRDSKIKAYKIDDEWRILHSDFVAYCEENWGNK